MMPAAQLPATTEKPRLGRSVKKITNAPAVVISQVKRDASNACRTGERFSR